MKKQPFITLLSAFLFLWSCDSDDQSPSSICRESLVCESTYLGQENIFPGNNLVRGTYQAIYQESQVNDQVSFFDGEVVDIELTESTLTIKSSTGCVTLSQPFRYGQQEQRSYYLDECVNEAAFIVQIQPNRYSSGFILSRINVVELREHLFRNQNPYGRFCIIGDESNWCSI